MTANCSKEILDEFSKKHYTYINQIFGDATVREIIEEEYPTTYKFDVEETGADFDFSYHHTVKDRDDGHILCSVDDGYQDIYKNKNDTLCQSYSLMNYFDIDIPDNKKDRQMVMIQMYRDILNGTLENFEGVNFKKILNKEILSVKENKSLWTDFVTDRGHINMKPNIFFKNIKNTLDEWEEVGYWFFIGKGNCPKHEHYSSEMLSQDVVSRELSAERDEGYFMGNEDVKIKPSSKSATRSKSVTIKNNSSPKTIKNYSSSKSATRRSKSSPKSKKIKKYSSKNRRSKSAKSKKIKSNSSPNSGHKKIKSNSSPNSGHKKIKSRTSSEKFVTITI
jgi:hypothetical protein